MADRSWRARLFAVALLPGVVVVAACTGGPGGPAAKVSAGPALSGCLRPPASCYAPHVFRVAYGVQPLLERGIDGRGETVTVLATPPAAPGCTGSASATCANLPGAGPPAVTDIRQDLKAFDGVFGLPAARIQVVNALARSASPWQAAGGEAGDLEMVHAVAPAATLRVVLMPARTLDSAATATAGMLAGLRLAVSGTDVATIGWGLGEHFFTRTQVAHLHAILRGAAAHHVTVVAGSGDNGAFSSSYGGTPVKEVSLPAASPLVLAVGGTTLTANSSTGAYVSETAWNGNAGLLESISASGGGFSHLYARPAYQDGVAGIGAMRGVPDVAGDAAQNGSAPVAVAADGKTSIGTAMGTSTAAALWAGLIAVADQDAHQSLGFVNPAIYRVARGSSYHKAFRDVTRGNNTVTMPYPAGTAGYKAAPGWDPVTGWGTPDAQVLIPLLASVTGRGKT